VRPLGLGPGFEHDARRCVEGAHDDKRHDNRRRLGCVSQYGWNTRQRWRARSARSAGCAGSP